MQFFVYVLRYKFVLVYTIHVFVLIQKHLNTFKTHIFFRYRREGGGGDRDLTIPVPMSTRVYLRSRCGRLFAA